VCVWCVYVYACVYVCVFACVCASDRERVFEYIRACVIVYECVRECMIVCVCIFEHAHMRACALDCAIRSGECT